MIVGHNPGLEMLVEQLTGERQDLPNHHPCAQIGLPIDQSARSQTVDPRGALGPLAA